MLREKGVVSKFVEFFGPGPAEPAASPTGRRSATCRRSSARPARSSRSTPRRSATSSSPGRPTEQIELVDAYTREQGLFHEPDSEDATYSDMLELDLGDVVPSIAGPKRPQDRIALTDAKPAFLEAMQEWDPEAGRAAREHARPRDRRVLPGLGPARRGPRRRGRQARGRRPTPGDGDAELPRRADRATRSRSSSRAARRSSSTTATSSSPRSRAAPTPRTRR